MKKRARLKDVYCIPKTEEEWKLFQTRVRSDREVCISSNGTCMTVRIGHCSLLGMTEIPVDRFLDLLNDRIVPWRLEEVGFTDELLTSELYSIQIFDVTIFVNKPINYEIDIQIGDEQSQPLNITTFTELLQMMKFLGWKP